MEVIGKVKRIEETKTVGNNGYEIRDLILTTEEQYPQTLIIQFVQGKVVELDKFKEGDNVKISINLKGREIEKDSKKIVYNTIQGWKIEAVV